MNKKYKLTDESFNINNKRVYRIQAVCSFFDVEEGDLGGFVESEKNLSHSGDCWIYDDSVACGKARVSDCGQMHDLSFATDNAKITISGCLSENASIHGDVIVSDRANLSGDAVAKGNVKFLDECCVSGSVTIDGSAIIAGKTRILGRGRGAI